MKDDVHLTEFTLNQTKKMKMGIHQWANMDSYLKKDRFRLDARKNLFLRRIVKQWNRLPRKVMQSASLGVFKTRLDTALSILA